MTRCPASGIVDFTMGYKYIQRAGPPMRIATVKHLKAVTRVHPGKGSAFWGVRSAIPAAGAVVDIVFIIDVLEAVVMKKLAMEAF